MSRIRTNVITNRMANGAPTVSNGLVISGEEKMVKPQKEIYQLAIDRFNLIPNETVFIDDNLDNIKTAITLDFKTIHLVDPHQIKSEIYKYLN